MREFARALGGKECGVRDGRIQIVDVLLTPLTDLPNQAWRILLIVELGILLPVSRPAR
jgi:hypothetical protein